MPLQVAWLQHTLGIHAHGVIPAFNDSVLTKPYWRLLVGTPGMCEAFATRFLTKERDVGLSINPPMTGIHRRCLVPEQAVSGPLSPAESLDQGGLGHPQVNISVRMFQSPFVLWLATAPAGKSFEACTSRGSPPTVMRRTELEPGVDLTG